MYVRGFMWVGFGPWCHLGAPILKPAVLALNFLIACFPLDLSLGGFISRIIASAVAGSLAGSNQLLYL